MERPMPRFYFDVTDTGDSLRDEEGLDLASVELARRQALAALGDMAKEQLPDRDHREFVVEVRDGGTEPILRATLSLNVERKV
jgi:hypothetical protein